jgi:nucleoside-diphosphate-sugar epimerase
MSEDADNLALKVDPSQFEGSKILITGASGLLGINLLEYFKVAINRGLNIDLTALVNSKPNLLLSHLVESSKAHLRIGDLTELNVLNGLDNFDYIIHAASYGQPGRFMSDPIKTLKLNTVVTFELFKLLKKTGKFIFLSTSEIYSGNPNTPYREDDVGRTNTTHPRACYIEAKRCGEAICNSYRESKGVIATSIRLALAYGPGTRPEDQRVLNTFIKRALLEKKITLQDLGNATRRYCYITDVLEIILKIMLTGSRPIYNIGGSEKISIGKLAEMIGNILNVPVEYPDIENKMNHAPEDVCLDMSLVLEDFKKKEFTSIYDGLLRTVEWQKLMYKEINND